jgi:hypothetical protein
VQGIDNANAEAGRHASGFVFLSRLGFAYGIADLK